MLQRGLPMGLERLQRRLGRRLVVLLAHKGNVTRQARQNLVVSKPRRTLSRGLCCRAIPPTAIYRGHAGEHGKRVGEPVVSTGHEPARGQEQ